MNDKPITVTDAEFEQQVLKAKTPVVVDFWAPWCGPCKMIAPVLEELAKEYAGQVTIAKVNTDENAEQAMRYGVRGIPTLIFFLGGHEVDRVVGAASRTMLKRNLDRLVAALVS